MARDIWKWQEISGNGKTYLEMAGTAVHGCAWLVMALIIINYCKML